MALHRVRVDWRAARPAARDAGDRISTRDVLSAVQVSRVVDSRSVRSILFGDRSRLQHVNVNHAPAEASRRGVDIDDAAFDLAAGVFDAIRGPRTGATILIVVPSGSTRGSAATIPRLV